MTFNLKLLLTAVIVIIIGSAVVFTQNADKENGSQTGSTPTSETTETPSAVEQQADTQAAAAAQAATDAVAEEASQVTEMPEERDASLLNADNTVIEGADSSLNLSRDL
jgi:hypothetical protein